MKNITSSFFNESPHTNGVLLFVLGIVFLLTIYNYLSYYQHKSKTYLYYATYTFLLFLAYFTFTKNDFLDQLTTPLQNFFSLTHEFWVWLYNIAYYLFAFRFLNFKTHYKKQTKIIKYILLFLFILGFIGFTTTLVLNDKNLLITLYLFAYIPIIILLTLYCFYLVYKTPEKTKNYILIGSFILFISSLLTILIIEFQIFTNNSATGFLIFYLGIVLENIFFSLGLGLRQKILLNERNEAKNQLILKLQENKELKEEMNFQLTEKLNVLKEQITLKEEIDDLKLITLKNQMNPHFIFNALNSIKLYIINNERKNATYYLNKFSKLIRKILEASSQKETTLNNELKTMDLYMNIENIRFSNEIDFEIISDENLNLETIKVPPLVFQPFLENALWHGLSSKKGDKKIRLSVSKIDENYIKIIIEDNGIGRDASAKIKSEKSINRKSVGIYLTEKRLNNFVKNYNNNFSINYEDLKDNKKNSLGTRVIIALPLF
ncbi:histidine kinase [Polaribacter vadi]|uniref:sensor histidine kinase n=1 Tax=Polaribacter TaxID=52959 RepID=UPI001C081D30|nr:MULTISPECIES: histidine kinase [Polaribacter]MBU3011530.1 histidine kinase [Polaribacter vadi]MDO6741343.1 histidine kinase [Polaribacter sp. 1_MG-2023]